MCTWNRFSAAAAAGPMVGLDPKPWASPSGAPQAATPGSGSLRENWSALVHLRSKPDNASAESPRCHHNDQQRLSAGTVKVCRDELCNISNQAACILTSSSWWVTMVTSLQQQVRHTCQLAIEHTAHVLNAKVRCTVMRCTSNPPHRSTATDANVWLMVSVPDSLDTRRRHMQCGCSLIMLPHPLGYATHVST